MKLNNRGWGLSFLIVIGVIFILILIFVSLRIKGMTHQLKDDDKTSKTIQKEEMNNSIYLSLEQALYKAGESYTVYHSSLIDNTSDHLIVWFDTLKQEGFIESLADPNGAGNCNGYVLIKNDYSINSFIKCSNYETLNYTLWVD